MATEKQRQASRANGARSRGPSTPQGKLNSSRNSFRHGLLAGTVVLEVESKGRFLELAKELFAEYQPATPTETMLVETMAAARWRLLRTWGLQKAALDHDIAACRQDSDSALARAAAAFRTSPDQPSSHHLLLRYETAADRQFNRALARLTKVRDARVREAIPSEISERTQQLAESKESAKVTKPPFSPESGLPETQPPESWLRDRPRSLQPFGFPTGQSAARSSLSSVTTGSI